MAHYCLARYDETTLSLPPEWTDIREFTWAGMRAHVRYTYRGWGAPYEKRVRIRPSFIHREKITAPHWALWHLTTGDSGITCVVDNRHAYYWRANEGGTWHTELVNCMIQEARALGLSFDLVGANSPHRGLFKRGFGGRLTPYYTVTTCTAQDLREAPPIYASANAVH